MVKKSDDRGGVIALATIFDEGPVVRGRIPAPVVKALKAKGGDVVAFERGPGGAVVLRKSTAAERKSQNKVAKK